MGILPILFGTVDAGSAWPDGAQVFNLCPSIATPFIVVTRCLTAASRRTGLLRLVWPSSASLDRRRGFFNLGFTQVGNLCYGEH